MNIPDWSLAKDVHPDLCVALGAGVLASRIGGHNVERVLVDVSPYSFGISFFGEGTDGSFYKHCYKPIIKRNTPLPLTRTDRYSTVRPFQTEVEIHVYQGEDRDALKNIPVGDFTIEGLTSVEEPNEVLCRMRLDLDGILEVTAVEKRTGKSKHITIANALASKSQEEIAAARERLQELYESRGEQLDGMWDSPEGELEGPEGDLDEEEDQEDAVRLGLGLLDAPSTVVKPNGAGHEVQDLLARSRRLLDRMHDDDREEAIDLHEKIEAAIASHDVNSLEKATQALKELLFFVEGKD